MPVYVIFASLILGILSVFMCPKNTGVKQRSITNKEGVNGAKHQEGGRPGNVVKTTYINVDGLVCDLKLERLCEHIAQHHIAVSVETRTNDVVSIFATATDILWVR